MQNGKVPRYNVVSLRVTDEELAELKSLTRQTRLSVSTIMRKALHLLDSSDSAGQKGH